MIDTVFFKNFSNEYLFILLFKTSTLFTVLYMFADFVTIYYNYETSKFVFLDGRRIFLEQNLLKMIGFVISILILTIILKNYNHYKVSIFFIVFTIFFLISYSLGGLQLRPMLFFGYLLTFFFYEFYPKVLIGKVKIGDSLVFKFSIILSIFLFAPLFVFCLHYMINAQVYFNLEFAPQLYIVDSFRGLTLDRIQYSYLVGILGLVTYFEQKIIKNYKIILFILAFALILAMSRAVVVSVIVSLLFYKINDFKKMSKFIFSVMLLIFSEPLANSIRTK